MLINNQVPAGEYRHNYVRLGFLVGTLLLFLVYTAVNQLAERGFNNAFLNATLRPEEVVVNDITPSYWVYRALDAFNYFWQLSWLLYTLTFIFRRSSGGYLYLSPRTLTPTFYIVYTLGFVIQAVWLIFFQADYIFSTWIIYLASFLLLSLALFIINNNLALNKKLYETEGLNQDVWFLRFLVQNGVAFFASVTAIRFILAFNPFLQVTVGLSVVNAGTVSLILAAVLAIAILSGGSLNATGVDNSAYQFSPWIVFILFFWGVVENNWLPGYTTRNDTIAAIELAITLISAVAALVLFTLRYRASKIDPIP